jgi:hypothetical protein
MGDRRGGYRSLVGKPEGQNNVEDLGVDVRIILKRIFKKSVGSGVDSIDLVQDGDQWWDVLNTVMNIWGVL